MRVLRFHRGPELGDLEPLAFPCRSASSVRHRLLLVLDLAAAGDGAEEKEWRGNEAPAACAVWRRERNYRGGVDVSLDLFCCARLRRFFFNLLRRGSAPLLSSAPRATGTHQDDRRMTPANCQQRGGPSLATYSTVPRPYLSTVLSNSTVTSRARRRAIEREGSESTHVKDFHAIAVFLFFFFFLERRWLAREGSIWHSGSGFVLVQLRTSPMTIDQWLQTTNVSSIFFFIFSNSE